MIDRDLQEQLKTVFAPLENSIELLLDNSAHPSQAELRGMLEALAATSPLIRLVPSGRSATAPSFSLRREGTASRLRYRGIPGGHEFSSLVLAVLNADGKGKMPDPGLAARIQALRGPIRLRTFISLSCENCPDVVQALQQMALCHPGFEHEMVDGQFAVDEVAALGIQGVPAVVAGDRLIHSGRIHFLDLLGKLEEHFGKAAPDAPAQARSLGRFDVVVIGGGPAGASAAIYSARKGMRTALLAERMGGQVKDTRGIENLISVPYTEGPQLAEQLLRHVASYPVELFDQRRVSRLGADRRIELEGGETIDAEAVIIATGAKWRELGVPGEKEYLGRGVAYCPHCDGPFYKGKKLAVVGGGNSGAEAAIDLAGIAGSVVLLEYAHQLKADQVLVDKLRSLPNVEIRTGIATRELEGDGAKLTGIRYLDRASEREERLALDGVFVQIGLIPNSAFAEGTVERTKFGEIVIDAKCRTSAKFIYAAGDVSTVPYKQIVVAMGEGAKAALAAFEERMLAP